MKKIKTLFIILIFFVIQHNSFATNEETLILFDSTASMLEPFGSSPKYVTAINETKKILNTLPNSKSIGLRMIGISIENSLEFLADNNSFCKATKLLAPIQTDNIENINNRLDMLFPLGTTPLQYSLEMAINNDFSQFSQKHIILITDGGESCDADPCGYIQRIMRTRNDIKIDVIAIGVSDSDLTQLKCLSNYTYGNITNITNPTEFSQTLSRYLLPKVDFVDEIKTQKTIINKDKEVIYKNYLLVE